ncbi:hypothetical protein BWI97_21145 [Siphonobacter sp. BAB-5405]|nr:hypothetical protein BWI97_21145 [Siphonobacter sp. BAB-5405]
MWGGTVDNPYQYFNGCQGTYISTQVCYDNPDAFWAHYTGQALGLNTGVGGPPPPAGEDFTLPGVTYDANQIGSQVDCSSFNFVRTTSAGQEAAIRFNLKFIGNPREGDPKVLIQYKYFKVQVPYETWNGRIIESGEAANYAARAFNGAMSDAIEIYKLYKHEVKAGLMTNARFHSEIQREFMRAYKSRLIEQVGSTGISVAHSYTAASPVLARDVKYAGMFGAYNCD